MLSSLRGLGIFPSLLHDSALETVIVIDLLQGEEKSNNGLKENLMIFMVYMTLTSYCD